MWQTIDESEVNGEEAFDEEDPEVVAMLQERIEKYERGEGKSYSWDEVKEMAMNKDKRHAI